MFRLYTQGIMVKAPKTWTDNQATKAIEVIEEIVNAALNEAGKKIKIKYPELEITETD